LSKNALPAVHRLVQRSQIRARLVAASNGALGYALFGGLAGVALGALVAQDALGETAGAVLLGLLAVAGVAYVVYAARLGTDAKAIARRLDGTFGTRDRLATALETQARGAAGTAFGAAVLADAERAAAGPLAGIVLPWHLPAHARTVALGLALCALLAAPHSPRHGEGRTISPAKAKLAADAADLAGRVLPDLEAAAEGKGLRTLAKRIATLKRLVKEDLKKLEEPDLKLWEVPPDARTDLMPHEEDAPKPTDLPDAAKVPVAPAVAGAAAAALAVSGVAGYAPVGKFDAGPVDDIDKEAFAELDAKLLKDSTLTPDKLMDLAKRVETVSKSLHNFGEDYESHGGETAEDTGAPAGEKPGTRGPTDWGSGSRWDAESKGLLMKSWGEYLRKYAFKLKEGALKGALAKATKDAAADKKRDSGEISVDLPASKVKLTDADKLKPAAGPPKKGAATMDVTAMGEMGKKMAMAALKDGEKTSARKGPEVMGDKTAVGGSGAGKGASDEEKKVDLESAKLDEDSGGESDITVIRDFGRFGPGTDSTPAYKEIFAGAVKTASGALDNGSVPPELKEYVRLYFNAIRPR
jgi:hypothetical protein